MTTRQQVTQVHRDEEGLVASCAGCGLALHTVGGFDPDVALGTWSLFHPAAPEALHRPAVPPGWRARPNGTDQISQGHPDGDGEGPPAGTDGP